MRHLRQGSIKAKRRTKRRPWEAIQERSAAASRSKALSRSLGKNKPYTVTVSVQPERTRPERPDTVDVSPGQAFTDAMHLSGGW